MASSASKTSLSASTPSHPPLKISDYQNLAHAPSPNPLSTAMATTAKLLPTVEPLSIKVLDTPGGTVPAFLHVPSKSPNSSSAPTSTTAAILLSGASGGVTGPSGIYLSMADKLAMLDAAIPVLRLDYRFPARNKACAADVLAGMAYLESRVGVQRFVLVGWSFGGAPAFTVGGQDERVVGCATVASQTAETEGIRRLAPRPVLLLHGTGDRILGPECSERLYKMYGVRKGEREVKFFEGDDHALTRNSLVAEKMLCEFVVRCAGASIGEDEWKLLKTPVVEGNAKVEVMKRGGDMGGQESVE